MVSFRSGGANNIDPLLSAIRNIAAKSSLEADPRGTYLLVRLSTGICANMYVVKEKEQNKIPKTNPNSSNYL